MTRIFELDDLRPKKKIYFTVFFIYSFLEHRSRFRKDHNLYRSLELIKDDKNW